ncbi:MAG: hypothetical protein ABR955_15910 [Verrucomicrobiota bacterium]|jgi:hypothetical protein
MEVASGKADAWRRRIDDQRASGQSVRAWCSANDVREHSFYFWRRRLNGPGDAPPLPPGLARVRVIDDPPPAEGVRLRLPGERELIFPASMSLEQVADLIVALGTRA